MEKHDSGFDEASYDDKAIRFSHTVIRFCVKILAILMTLLIIWGGVRCCLRDVHEIKFTALFLIVNQ